MVQTQLSPVVPVEDVGSTGEVLTPHNSHRSVEALLRNEQMEQAHGVPLTSSVSTVTEGSILIMILGEDRRKPVYERSQNWVDFLHKKKKKECTYITFDIFDNVKT